MNVSNTFLAHVSPLHTVNTSSPQTIVNCTDYGTTVLHQRCCLVY